MVKSGLTVRLVIGAILVLAAGSAAAWMVRLPGVDAQLPPLSEFSILQPENETIVFLHEDVTIHAQVPARTTQKSTGFEVWVDGALNSTDSFYVDTAGVIRFSTTPAPGGSTPIGPGGGDLPPAPVFFQWTPEATGEHTLMVRAVGPGFVQNSDVVNVQVVDPAALGSGTTYHPQVGDTLLSVADKFNLSSRVLGAANPGIPGLNTDLTTLPGGDGVIIPLSGQTFGLPPNDSGTNGSPTDASGPNGYGDGHAPDGSATDPAATAPNKLGIWLGLHLFAPLNTTAYLPPAPILLRSFIGCDTHLYIRDNSSNELGFFVYRLNPGSTTFTRIATLGPHKGVAFIEYVDKGLYGNYQYYVSAFNALGESASNLVSVVITHKSCIKTETAALIIEHLNIHLNGQADKAYCYYSLQEGLWSRLPEDPQAFLYPTGAGFDVSRQMLGGLSALPPQAQLSFDCWGWSGGNLLHLGAASGPVTGGGDTPMKLDGDGISVFATLVDFQFAPDRLLPPGLLSIVRVPTPYNLRQTTSLDICAGHFPYGSSSATERAKCMEPIKNKDLILVWEWDPICAGSKGPMECIAKIDGYHVYAMNPAGAADLKGTVTDRNQTAFFLSGAIPGMRYFVRAFYGVYESPRSNIYTVVDMPAGYKAVSMGPSVLVQQVVETPKYRSSPCAAPLGGLGLKSGSTSFFLTAGFMHAYASSGCLESSDHFYRGRVGFDLSSIAGYVVKASLAYAPDDTQVDGKPDSSISCAASLNLITATSGDMPTTFTPYLTLPATGKLSYSLILDVTKAVKDWVDKTNPNLGFLLVGQETGFPKADKSCVTRYDSFNLSVYYFVK